VGKESTREGDASSDRETAPGIGEGSGWDTEDEGCDIGWMEECYECVAEVKEVFF